MAMVNIQRGQFKTRVSKKAYESFFKNKGYRIVSEDSEKEEEHKIEMMEEHESETVEESDNIPISDMNAKQLRKFAEENGIDVSGAKSTEQARAIVRKTLKERNM